MYYSKLKSERIARTPALHANRRSRRALHGDPNVIDVEYPVLTDKENLMLHIHALCPELVTEGKFMYRF